MEYPQRKTLRLPGYNYSRAGTYFVTVCAAGRHELFGTVSVSDGENICVLSPNGEIVKRYIESIPSAYPDISLDKYVIMPNHIHILLTFRKTEARRPGAPRSTQRLPRVIATLKRFSNRDVGWDLWQARYHDHIIRDEKDFWAHWQYIDQNPACWTEDDLYAGEQP